MENLSVHEVMLIEDLPEEVKRAIDKLIMAKDDRVEDAYENGYEAGFKAGRTNQKLLGNLLR